MKYVMGLLIVVIIAGAIWFALGYMNTTPIGKIIQNPRDFDKKDVTISGTVTDRSSLMFVNYFTVQDKTGEIKVLSKKAMPAVGSKIQVSGKIDNAFELGDMQILILVEK